MILIEEVVLQIKEEERERDKRKTNEEISTILWSSRNQ